MSAIVPRKATRFDLWQDDCDATLPSMRDCGGTDVGWVLGDSTKYLGPRNCRGQI